MSSICDRCGKRPSFGRTVARKGRGAMRRLVKGRVSRMFRPNIQTVRAPAGGTQQLCTSCIKKGRATPAP